MSKSVKTTKENSTGRNIRFLDIKTNKEMTRAEFVKEIKKNNSNYDKDYYVRKQNGLDTPVSKPDNSKRNNLD